MRQGFSTYSYYGQENNIHLARLLTRNGQLAEAKPIIQSALDVTDQKGMMLLHTQALMADGLMDIKEGKYAFAEEKLIMALQIAEKRGMGQEVIWGKFRLAFMEFSRNRFDSAENLLIDVLEKAKSYKINLLQKYALVLAFQLSQHKTVSINSNEIRASMKFLDNKLMAHTQSKPLREDLEKAQRIWRKGFDLN